MFYCRNGSLHKHTTVAESRRCWAGVTSVPAPPVPASPPVSAAPIHPNDQPRSISGRQKKYINDLGGHWEIDWSYNRASHEITTLLANAGDRKKAVEDPRLAMISGMIDMIPDGYYATAADGPGGHVDFLRISRPTKGRYRGTLKIQTQHSERWAEAMVKYPNHDKWSVYRRESVSMLMLVIADHHGCAKRYAIEKQACMCCTKTLTDDRSRHYLIGPVCDQKDSWKWVIEEVDNKNMGLSFEQLVGRGLPTRVWQDAEFAKGA